MNYTNLENIQNPRILNVIHNLPRELFVNPEFANEAYGDYPLPIACGQTISQPSLVAYMTEKLELKETDRVLEIGTGSGFQTAMLAQLVKKVYTIEIHQELSLKAQATLKKLGYSNVHYKVGDGKLGWPEFAPFDKIIITATAEHKPQILFKQLAKNGKMIFPELRPNGIQWLVLVHNGDNFREESLIPVRFVALV